MEVQQLIREIGYVADRTEFNRQKLLSIAARIEMHPRFDVFPHVMNGGRSSNGGLQLLPPGNSLRTQLENAQITNDFNYGVLLRLQIFNWETGMQANDSGELILINLAHGIGNIDMGFMDFVRDEMYDHENIASLTNMQRFTDTMQQAIRNELRMHELWFGDDLGSEYISVDFDEMGRIIVGSSNDKFSLESVRYFDSSPYSWGTEPLPNDIGNVFLGLLGDDAVGMGSRSVGYDKGALWLVPVNVYDHLGKWIQMGANAAQGAFFVWDSMIPEHLGINDINVLTVSSSEDTIIRVDLANSMVGASRALLGAYVNRLEASKRGVLVSSEALSAAFSRIRDADMAQEMMKLTQANILETATTSLLAQANHGPLFILQLLGEQ
jgi:hypothetical protein